MELSDFKKSFQDLLDNYEDLKKHFEERGADECFETWYYFFKDVSTERFRVAVKNYIHKEGRLPTVASINRYLPPKQNDGRVFEILDGGAT